MLRHYYIQYGNDRMNIPVYKISKEKVPRSSKCTLAKVNKILRNSEAPFRDRVRKFRLIHKKGFLIKKTCCVAWISPAYIIASFLAKLFS